MPYPASRETEPHAADGRLIAAAPALLEAAQAALETLRGLVDNKALARGEHLPDYQREAICLDAYETLDKLRDKTRSPLALRPPRHGTDPARARP